MQQLAGYQPEDRSPEDFRKEVESHIEELRKAAPVVAAARVMAKGEARLLPVVENPTEANFQRVRVRLHVPGPVFAVDLADEEEWSETRLPLPPRTWGSMRPSTKWDFMPSVSPPRLVPSQMMPRIRPSGPHIKHDGSATLTFDAIDVRPRDTVQLDPFHLLVRPELVGKTIEATWEATSTSADGVAAGVLAIGVCNEGVSVEQLLEADMRNGEGKD